MEQSFYEQIILIVFAFAMFLAIGWKHRTNDSAKFHTENRNIGAIRTPLSVFTVIGAPHYAFMTMLAFAFGVLPIALYLGSCVGFVLLGIMAPRIREYGNLGAHTFADIPGHRARFSGFTLASLGFLFSIGVLMTQIVAGVLILGGLVPEVPHWVLAILVGLVIIGYLLGGGYRALIWTDTYQAILMLILSVVLLTILFAPDQVPLWQEPFSNRSWDQVTPLIPMLFVSGVILELGAPVNWQRILSASDSRVARKSMFIASALIVVGGMLILSIATAIIVGFPEQAAKPEHAFVGVILNEVPFWVSGIAIVLLLAALLSTADSALFVSAIMSHAALLKLRIIPSQVTDEANPHRLDISVTRWIIAIIGGIAIFFAVLFPDSIRDAFGILLNLALISGPLAVCVLLQRGGRTEQQRAIMFGISLALALLCFVSIVLFIGDFFTWWSLLLVCCAAFPLLISSDNKK